MRGWLNSTLPLLIAIGASGCLVHERPELEVDAGAIENDAWIWHSWPAYDAGPDASVVAIDAEPMACAHSDVSVGIRVEPITTDVARCAFSHAEGVSLTGVDAAPDDHGIRIHLDLCPAADADCRCDIVVSNVGTDLATELGPNTSVTIDVSEGESFLPGPHLAISKIPTCECDGCGCSEPLYLYAATASPDFAPSVPAPMTFANGALVCSGDCSSGDHTMLHAIGDFGATDVPGGTTRDLGSVHVRSLRDVEVFEPCAACAGCDTPVGAWIAWVTSR